MNNKGFYAEIIYTGDNHPVLKKGNIYPIYKPETVSEESEGLQVKIPTGFCGIPKKDFIFVEEQYT